MYTIANPWWFIAVALPLGLLVWYIRKPRTQDELQVKNPLLESLVKFSQPQVFRHFAVAGLFLAMVVAVTLIAGFRYEREPLKTDDIEEVSCITILVVDNSESMLGVDQGAAEDRLTIAKRDLTTAVDGAGVCNNLGLVSFGGLAEVVLTPTEDRTALKEAIENLPISAGGTASGEGLALAVDSCQLVSGFNGLNLPCNILLVSDGKERAGDGQRTMEQGLESALDAEATVYTVAYGSELAIGPEGQIYRDSDAPALQEVSTATGGEHFPAEAPGQLADALANVESQTTFSPGVEVPVPAHTPLWPRLFGAFLLALLSVPFVRTIRQ